MGVEIVVGVAVLVSQITVCEFVVALPIVVCVFDVLIPSA